MAMFISHFTPNKLMNFLLIATLATAPIFISAIDVTGIISSFPELSTFSDLLTSTGVASELSGRNSLTLLAVPNSQLSAAASVDLIRRLPPPYLADLIRLHVLLRFLSPSDLRRIQPSGSTVTTLNAATGRASASASGSVNITREPETNTLRIQTQSSNFPNPQNATVLKILKTLSPNITVLTVDSLLIPAGTDLTAVESLPSPPPMGLNITQTLIDAHGFNVAVSMLSASGVVSEFEADERGAGITLFIPTDAAFAELPATVRLQTLPAEQKSVVLKFHVLHCYYPLGSLESITNPVQPTLATEEMGAGSYTLNISRTHQGVAINSGIVLANVSRTVFDQNPVAIFGVSKVLLPREVFGGASASGKLVPGGSSGGTVGPPAPELSIPPESDDLQSRVSSISSADGHVAYFFLGLYCMALCVLI